MPRQAWVETVFASTVAGTSLNTSAAEALIYPDVSFDPSYLQGGRCLRLRVKGKHSTLGSGTVTTVFRVRLGGLAGTLLCASAAITQLISLTNAYWDFDVELQQVADGSAGSIIANGTARMFGATAPTIGSATGAPAVAPMTAGGQTAPAIVGSLNLSIAQVLSITAQMGASSASNIIQGLQYSVDVCN